MSALSPAGHRHLHDPGRGHQENPQRRIGVVPLQPRPPVKNRLRPLLPRGRQSCGGAQKGRTHVTVFKRTHTHAVRDLITQQIQPNDFSEVSIYDYFLFVCFCLLCVSAAPRRRLEGPCCRLMSPFSLKRCIPPRQQKAFPPASPGSSRRLGSMRKNPTQQTF